MSHYKGQCLCGAIYFVVNSEPKWCAHCHCQLCRQAHSSPIVTWVGVDEANVKFPDGQNAIQWFHSSEQGQRGFCKTCGTTLFFKHPRWPGELHITREAFQVALPVKPTAHVYFDRHVDYLAIVDDLKKLGGDNGTSTIENV